MTTVSVLRIMVRRVNRIWEFKVNCSRHYKSSISAALDNKDSVITEALEKLSCDCWKARP